MNAIGFDAASGSLVISDLQVYPAGTLCAIPEGDGMIRIWSRADRVEFRAHWSKLTRLNGTGFADEAETLAYLNDEFDRGYEITDLLAAYILAKS